MHARGDVAGQSIELAVDPRHHFAGLGEQIPGARHVARLGLQRLVEFDRDPVQTPVFVLHRLEQAVLAQRLGEVDETGGADVVYPLIVGEKTLAIKVDVVAIQHRFLRQQVELERVDGAQRRHVLFSQPMGSIRDVLAGGVDQEREHRPQRQHQHIGAKDTALDPRPEFHQPLLYMNSCRRDAKNAEINRE